MTKRKSKRHSKGPPPSLKKINPAAAQSGLQKYPTDALVGTMNIILDIIRHRGTEILDWDDKEKGYGISRPSPGRFTSWPLRNQNRRHPAMKMERTPNERQVLKRFLSRYFRATEKRPSWKDASAGCKWSFVALEAAKPPPVLRRSKIAFIGKRPRRKNAPWKSWTF